MPRGAKPKVYDTEVVHRVQVLYDSGCTQQEIAAQIGISQKVIWNIMRRHGIQARVAAKRDQRGAKNSTWKGDDAGYQALHLRVERARGKEKRCEECGTTEQSKSYDWANLTGKYEDINDYKRLCRSCHWKLDEKVNNLRKGVPSA